MNTTQQVAALPVRPNQAGIVEILLVTSRETRRWVLPKGWPWPGMADHMAAAGEAHEEAGVQGRAAEACIGSYRYGKRDSSGVRLVDVAVFLLMVELELEDWPERAERRRAWFTPEAAAEAVDEPELRQILRALSGMPLAELQQTVRTAAG